ncbi:thiamine diphosphokinase [Lancefieldella parvula]|uniref:thiamine diphosphokinase n=1 Tax=Lancefieldella parvula TaxID=1382 RepID=UPI00288AA6AB|nr:thiamine diphosphokinase [Lancefieldella parvula]
MQVTGAIFDCDGTLVDSMCVWHNVFSAVLPKYGKTVDPDIFDRVEAVSLIGGCQICVDELALPVTAETLYEEFCAYATDQYQHHVSIIPGAKEFLQELYDAGIPLAVASSTPVREVRAALAAQGIEHLFKTVVSTEDVGGVDKVEPDVYLEALRRLGTDKVTTWVFEDAPFGAQTAQKAGFPVVALYNDHDGRDPVFMREHSNIFAHTYGELSLLRLCDYERPLTSAPSGEKPLEVLIVGGSPEAVSKTTLSTCVQSADYLIAVDHGADACHVAGVVPQLALGDFDSASAETLSWLKEQQVPCMKFNADKYDTDLALALKSAEYEAIRRNSKLSLTVVSTSGGHLDHQLVVLGLLAAWAKTGKAKVRVVENDFEMRFLAADQIDSWQLNASATGKKISLVALSEECEVSESGMRWNLNHEKFTLLGDDGISNIVEAGEAWVKCEKGCLLVQLWN